MFKVGDWVRHNEGICQVKGLIIKSSMHRGGTWLSTDYSDGRAIPIDDCELWKPEDGELIIRYAKCNDFATIEKYNQKIYRARSIKEWGIHITIEPFVIELPSCLFNILKDL